MSTYRKTFFCENCEEEKTFDIPFGTTIEHFLVTTKCPYCGCFKFKKTKNKRFYDIIKYENLYDDNNLKACFNDKNKNISCSCTECLDHR